MNDAISRRPVAWTIAAFCALFFVSLPFNNLILIKYWLSPSRAYDLNFYLNIAEKGYQTPTEPAFYPAWPWLASIVHGTVPEEWFVQSANLISLLLFFLSLRVLWDLSNRLTNRETANWTILLFALNPNSVFHAIAYPESLFALLAALSLYATMDFWSRPNWLNGGGLFASSALMSATRPIILQFIAAAIVAFAVTYFVFSQHVGIKDFRRNFSRWFTLTSLATVVGYLPFGYLCLQKFGNFFQPFAAQNAWDRKFGVYWSLITNPKSVAGSDNILTWDIQGFYLPAIVALLYVLTHLRKQNPSSDSRVHTDDPLRSFIIIFCLMIAAAHSAIAFLTYPIFMSLARHVFATPFFFVGAVAVVHDLLPARHRKKLLWFYLVGSVLYLLNFWTRFGNSSWMG